MTQPISVMLDLETWGTEPGCDIRSIGACVFDPVTGYVAHADGTLGDDYFYLACDNPKDRFSDSFSSGETQRYPLTRDPRTVQWWSEQSDEAQAAFTDPVDLRVALERFGAWVAGLTREARYSEENTTCNNQWSGLRLWSHAPHFDGPILAAAYKAVGLPVPWHYRAPRDTRTAFDLAGIDDHSAWLAQHPGPLGVQHHALDDAICQARAVCGAYDRLRIPHDVVTHRDAWRNGLMQLVNLNVEEPDGSYWMHEVNAFDHTFVALAAHPRLES